MKILLSNPPWYYDERIGVRAGSRWPHLKRTEEEDYMPYPFFLGYSSSLLIKNGFNVKTIDAVAKNIDEQSFLNLIKKYKPNLLFLEISTPSLENDLRIIKSIRRFYKEKIAVSSPDTNLLDEHFLKKYTEIDYILKGEYEFTLLELAKTIKDKKSSKNLLGLIYRNKDKIIKNLPRPLCNLDELPWPDRKQLPIFDYHDNPGSIPSPCGQIIASRGCPFKCIFCVWPQIVYGERNYRTRNIKDVADEMMYLIKLGAKSIYFDDDTFNIGKKRILELAEELKKRNWNIPWAFMGRADLVDEEIIIKLKKVGLKAVKFGIESAVQDIVNNAKKNLDLNKATKNIIMTKKYGIKIHLTFTFGLPGETRETIKKTVDYAIMLNPESVQFSILTPFPGTDFFNELNKKGMITTNDFNKYDGNSQSVIRTDKLSPEELTKSQEFAYRTWEIFKLKNNRYKNKSPSNLFFECLKENGFIYTINHTLRYIKQKNYRLYKNEKKHL